MSCDFYPPISKEEACSLQLQSQSNEEKWFIKNVIVPGLPSIEETLSDCVSYLQQDTPNTLPLSSSKSETLKGIIVRSGAYVNKLEFVLKLKGISKSPTKFSLKEKILLPQIVDATNSIEDALELLKVVKQNIFKDNQATLMLNKLEKLLNMIDFAKSSLRNPSPSLLFPVHWFERQLFEPEIPLNLSLDVYITNSDIALEIKSLDEVTEKPWCGIDENGYSYIDQVRENLKNDRKSSINDVLNESGIDTNVLIASSASSNSSFNESTNYLNSFLKNFKKYQPLDYITRGVTYRSKVVIVLDKTEVTSLDPILLLISTKLDSLKHVVTNLYTNLKHVSV